MVEREEKEREKERKKGEKGGRVIKSKWRKDECDEWKGFGIGEIDSYCDQFIRPPFLPPPKEH